MATQQIDCGNSTAKGCKPGCELCGGSGLVDLHCMSCNKEIDEADGEQSDTEDGWCCGNCVWGSRRCKECAGTGIGKYGDPNTSKCGYCRGGIVEANVEH